MKKGKLKFIIPMASAVILSSILPFNAASAATTETTAVPYTEKKITSWNESKNDISAKSKTSKVQAFSLNADDLQSTSGVTILHNDGKPIETNIIGEQKIEASEDNPDAKEEDNNLFAVVEYNKDGKTQKDYYFSNQESDDLNEVKDKAKEEQKALDADKSTFKAMAVASGSSYTNTYHFNFYNKTSKKKESVLTNSLQLNRKSSSTTINGKKGSVWDVKSISQVENPIINPPVMQWIQRLAVPYSAEKLIDEGPASSSAAKVNVSLSGLTPGISWDFSLGGTNIKNSSSYSGKYGRWTLKRNTLNFQPKSLKMTPGIRATNTSGNFAVQMSHQYDRRNSPHNTGVITMSVPDR